MNAFHRILVPTDLDSVSHHATEVASVIAARFDARLTLFHAWLPAVGYSQCVDWPTRAIANAAQKALDAEVEHAKEHAKSVDSVLACGAAGPLIVELVRERCFDLVVMGTHGRHGISRIVMGSIAESVIRNCPAPVLTVPYS